MRCMDHRYAFCMYSEEWNNRQSSQNNLSAEHWSWKNAWNFCWSKKFMVTKVIRGDAFSLISHQTLRSFRFCHLLSMLISFLFRFWSLYLCYFFFLHSLFHGCRNARFILRWWRRFSFLFHFFHSFSFIFFLLSVHAFHFGYLPLLSFILHLISPFVKRTLARATAWCNAKSFKCLKNRNLRQAFSMWLISSCTCCVLANTMNRTCTYCIWKRMLP